MTLARVTANVVSTEKHVHYEGRKILVVQPVGPDGKPKGKSLVAVDGVLGRMGGAGPGREGRNLDHFCLNVDGFDLAEVTRHLEAHGVAVGDAGQRYGAGGEGLSVYLSDPEGNGLELRA